MGSCPPGSTQDEIASAWPYRVILALALSVFAGEGLLAWLPAGPDDVFISLWAGEQLAVGHGFVNFNGEPLEICSSALHACIIALLALAAPGHVYLLNKLTCLAAGAGILIVISLYRSSLFARGPAPFLAYAFTLLALAVNPSLLYWSLGGLETPFAALILTTYVLALTRYWENPSNSQLGVIVVSQCLYTVIRPEGFFVLIFTLVFIAFHWWFKGGDRRLAALSLPAVAFYGVIMIARWIAFGMLFPNPVYAKAGDPFGQRKDGLAYLLDYFSTSYFALAQLVVLTILTIYFSTLIFKSLSRRNRNVVETRMAPVFLFGMCVTGSLFVVLSGGDWMGYSRFVVPFLPLLIILTVNGVFSLQCAQPPAWKTKKRTVVFKSVISALLLLLLGTCVTGTGFDLVSLVGKNRLREGEARIPSYNVVRVFAAPWESLDQRIIYLNTKHRRELARAAPAYHQIIPELLKKRKRLTIISGQMGLFPYMLRKRFPNQDIYLVDLHGLCTREIAEMDLGRNLGGVRAGDLSEIFPPNGSELSRFVVGLNPDIAYVARMNPPEVKAMRESGFVVVEDKGRPNIAYRPVEPVPSSAND